MADPKDHDEELDEFTSKPNEGVDEDDMENAPVNNEENDEDSGQARMTDGEDEGETEAADDAEPENGGEDEPDEEDDLATSNSPLAENQDEAEPESEKRETSMVTNEDFEDLPEDSSTGPREHTLSDLAAEEGLPVGVEPGKPKRFSMMDEDKSFAASQVPSSGLYSSDRNFNRRGMNNNNPRKKGKALALILVVLIAIGAAVYLLKFRHSLGNFQNQTADQTTTAPVASEEPTPSPTPSFDRSQYKIRVLNGTSTTGLAASVSGKLTSLGYQADKVGNATNSAFTQTQVRAKSAAIAAGLIDQLIKDLSPDYSAASSSADLKDSDSADAEVIIGAK